MRRIGDWIKRHIIIVSFVGCIAVLCGVVYTLAYNAEQNRLAIEKGCVLLNNAIVRSTQAAVDPNGASAALVAGILRVIPKEFVEQYEERVKGQTTVVPLIDCENVADHPEEIRAIPLKPDGP